MKPIEISDDLFCGRTDFCDAAVSNGCEELSCGECHRKWPTPEQFKEEYGKDWTGAVYYHCTNGECDTNDCTAKEWSTKGYGCLCDPIVICACAPFGWPDKDWRPE